MLLSIFIGPELLTSNNVVSRDFPEVRNSNFVSFHIACPPLAAGDGRKMRCENPKKSRTRRVAARERERVFFPDGTRCSISGVVGAVIVEDRLLSHPFSPFLPFPLMEPFAAPTSSPPKPPPPPPPLLQNAPYANLPAARRISLPHSLTFPTTSHPPFSTVSRVIGCPSILSLSPTAQACGSPEEV